MNRARAPALGFILVAVLIDMLAIGLIIPVLPALVGEFTGSQTEPALWFGAVTFAFAFASQITKEAPNYRLE
jgi:DHA1 family tetracycline resistance protein-like MFS transporter